MLVRGHITPIEGSKESDNLSSNHLSKEMTMLVPLHLITKILKKRKRKKKDVLDVRKSVIELKIVEYKLLKKNQISYNLI